MLDSEGLAKIALDEAHILGTTSDQIFVASGGALQNETSEQKLANHLEYAALPTSSKSLAHVIEEVFWSSVLTEESRPCRPRLAYRMKVPREPFHRFAEPIPLTRETLRRLTPALGSEGVLIWEDSSGRNELVGIFAHESNDRAGGQRLPARDLSVSAPKAGSLAIDWSWRRIVSLLGGEMRRLSECRLPEVSAALHDVGSIFGTEEPWFMARAVRQLARQGHGGSIWIAHPDCELASGLTLGRPVEVDRRPLMPASPGEATRGDYFAWLRSVVPLTAVDGAVLLDARGSLLGFNAFVELGAPVDVVRHMADGTTRVVRSSEVGGGRHQSAVHFCKRFAPCAAIVASEDGRVSIFSSQNRDALPSWQEISTTGRLESIIV